MKVLWFDCETSGIAPYRHGIIELAYQLEINGKTAAEGVLHSNCDGYEIDDAALEVNKFNRQALAEFSSPHHMYLALAALFAGHVDKYERDDKLIAGGYNVEFDVNFLRALWDRSKDEYFGSWFAFGVLDPARIVRFLQYTGKVPWFSKMTLVELAKYYGVERPDAHDALADITMTRDIVAKIKGTL